MKNKPPQAVLEVASRDPHLGRLLAKAQRLQRLEAHLRRALSPELAAQIRVADLRNGLLVLGAPSPGAASRLRYAKADIVKALGADCSKEVREVRVRVLGGS